MNKLVRGEQIRIGASVCPHDCPSTCALEIEIVDDRTIGRVRGAKDNDYTLGVVCAKVGRYAERANSPHRVTHPLRRTGPKGSGQFERISWDDALDIVAEEFLKAEQRHGSEAIWPASQLDWLCIWFIAVSRAVNCAVSVALRRVRRASQSVMLSWICLMLVFCPVIEAVSEPVVASLALVETLATRPANPAPRPATTAAGSLA